MQLIAATAALFASAALATPQFRPAFVVPPNDGPFFRPGIGGDPNGPYHGGCTCQVFGQISPDIGKKACENLGNTYHNLVWNEFQQACVDLNGLGIEEGGFTDSCKDVTSGFYGPEALFGFDLSLYVFAACTFF